MNDALRSAVRLATLAGAVALASAPAFAQVTPASGATPPDDTPSVKVGVTIYTDYTYIDEPTVKDADGNVIHSNAFNVGRAYVNVTGNLSHWVSFRVTPDVARESGNGSSLSGSLTYRLKYAFGQVNLDDFLPHGSWVRLGVQQTPYLDFMEGIYRYRFQGTMFPEREGFITSSDFGLTGHLNFGGNYGDIHAGVYNGEGYSKAEANDQKAFQVRGSLRPFPLGGALRGLRLHAFYDADRYIKNGARNRFVGTATFEHAHLNAGVDYLEVKDRTSINSAEVRGNGWAVWAVPRFLTVAESKPGLEGLVRYDSMRPNKNLDARRHRLIVGLAYWFPFLRGPSAALLADMDRATFDTLLNKPTDRRYSLHALFAF